MGRAAADQTTIRGLRFSWSRQTLMVEVTAGVAGGLESQAVTLASVVGAFKLGEGRSAHVALV